MIAFTKVIIPCMTVRTIINPICSSVSKFYTRYPGRLADECGRVTALTTFLRVGPAQFTPQAVMGTIFSRSKRELIMAPGTIIRLSIMNRIIDFMFSMAITTGETRWNSIRRAIMTLAETSVSNQSDMSSI